MEINQLKASRKQKRVISRIPNGETGTPLKLINSQIHQRLLNTDGKRDRHCLHEPYQIDGRDSKRKARLDHHCHDQ